MQEEADPAVVEERANDSQVGGRLARFTRRWEKASRWTKKIVQRGVSWKFASKPPRITKVLAIKPSLDPYIEDMAKKGVIETCQKPLFLAKFFGVPKPEGALRLVTDLSQLNKHIILRRFKFPSLKTLRSSLPEGCWMAKVDLKEAYWHVPVNVSFRPYLAFFWKGKFLQFKVLPFGLSIAPIVFAALMRFPVKEMERRNLKVSNYLDDFLIWEKSKEDCIWSVKSLIEILSKLGLLINMEKSVIVPTKEIIWLGIEWNTLEMSLRLPEGK